MKHLVVIPTYNEKENIEKLIRTVFELYPQISILIVDDSSPDGTSKIVEELKKEFSNLFLLNQSMKMGLANAYINGFKWGLDKGFDLFTSLDADFSHNPLYIKTAICKINEGYDIALGSRYIKGGSTNEKDWFRNFTSIFGNLYTRMILGKTLYDWTGGFNTYTKNALEKIDLNNIKVKGYIFQAEMKYKAFKKGCKFSEFPINFEVRTQGKSKMNYVIVLEALFSVLKIKINS